jgi:hypothetical protein
MSRARQEDLEMSLDAFLNVMKIVIGVLILVVLVSVFGGGEVGVPSGVRALAAPKPSATRVLFECRDGAIYRLDEEANAKRVQEVVRAELSDQPITPQAIADVLASKDVGDRRHRVQAEVVPQGLAWVYTLRADAVGESTDELAGEDSSYRKALDSMGSQSFAYFVVHDDSFETFRAARELAIARGLSVGWHPLEGHEPVRFSANGSLGTRVQ